jgi:sortase (surface protein transpeptidase)
LDSRSHIRVAWKKAGYVILPFLTLIQKVKAKTANIMILMGVLVLSLSANSAWSQYNLNHSVFDVVDTFPQRLDSNNNLTFPPPISPTRTPFQPSTLTPFQPQDDQEAPIVSSDGSLAETLVVTPESAAAKSKNASSTRTGFVPDRLIIPALQLDAPIVPIHFKAIEYDNQTIEQWLVPNLFAAGWHDTSALLGLPGNIVLNGHHNAYGQVFKDLIKLKPKDLIRVYSGERFFTYQVVAKMLFPERYRPLEERIANARWILPSDDERLTIISCWPADSNTGRIVIVAFPIKR